MNFGKRIQELRKKNNLSQEDLAEKIGVTRQTISKWELEETSPDIKQSKKIAEIFNLTVDNLINEKAVVKKQNNKTNMTNIIGLIILDIFAVLFFIFMLAWLVVMISFAISLIIITVCLIGNINLYNIIPNIPYHCKILLSISFLSLAILTITSSLLYTDLINNLKGRYKNYHKNIFLNLSNKYEGKSLFKNKKLIKKVAIISLITFIIIFILSIVVCMITANNIAFWHKWNWFN